MYRRGQLGEAVGSVLEESPGPRADIRTRLKRLLDLDRNLGRNKGSSDPEPANFAFYSKEGPGKGAENAFSEYEAFAVLMALQMMQHGWTQGFVVAQLRRLRAKLEKAHRRILRRNPASLLDKTKISYSTKRHFIVPSSTDPMYLVMVSSEDDRRLIKIRIYDYEETQAFMRDEGLGQAKGLGIVFSIFPLVNRAHQLHYKLIKSEPRKRGRRGK